MKFNRKSDSEPSFPPGIPFRECRAKTCPDGSPGTTVFDHCRYAGYVAEGLLALLPDSIRGLLPPETPFLVSLHDVGKVSPEFEIKYFDRLVAKYAPEWLVKLQTKKHSGGLRGHASIGAISLITEYGFFPDDAIVSAVAAHHGFAPPQKNLCPNDDCGDTDSWQNERKHLIFALAQEFGVLPDSIKKLQCRADLLAGITCVSDWIASDEEFFPPDERPLSSGEGRQRAAVALARCGFAKASFLHGLSFRDIFGFDPYPAQQAFLDEVDGPGVYVLEAPMGMGKTESALYAAYRLVEKGVHSGLYFALPTRLTSDRIHKRVEQFLEAVSAAPTPVKLAHGQAWLKEDENKGDAVKLDWGGEGTRKGKGDKSWFEIFDPNKPDTPEKLRVPRWFNPSKRGLLFPFAVGTIDQALLAVLNVKHSFVRSFALAGKVVVLDEVHSYDAYTGTLLDKLVRHLRDVGCTVIILSATLTAVRRKSLLGDGAPEADGYPLLTGIRAGGPRLSRPLDPPPSRAVRLRWIDAVAQSPIAAAVEKARAGCNVLCIANTVATAQEWFRTLKSEMVSDEFPVGLLHAKFTSRDRERLEEEWMAKLGKPDREGRESARPRGSILVSTQIVEQSVDIDADWMLSELAPADMLLQRLGRLWRHERPEHPVAEPELAVVCAAMPPDDLSALPTKAKELEPVFGRGVWVYAPYVLLRTFEELRKRESIAVPDDIRGLLKAVYSDAVPETEPHASLHAAMTKRIDELRRCAIMGEADSLPTRNDDEETVGTRYNSRPSVSLLLVRSLDTATGEAVLLDGTAVTLSRFQRDFKVTRELYRNLVQVPVDDLLLAAKGKGNDLLAKHFFPSEMPVVCKWNPETGALSIREGDADAGYCYHPLYGAYRASAENAEAQEPPENPDVPETPNIPNVPAEHHQIPDPEGEFYFKDNEDW